MIKSGYDGAFRGDWETSAPTVQLPLLWYTLTQGHVKATGPELRPGSQACALRPWGAADLHPRSSVFHQRRGGSAVATRRLRGGPDVSTRVMKNSLCQLLCTIEHIHHPLVLGNIVNHVPVPGAQRLHPPPPPRPGAPPIMNIDLQCFKFIGPNQAFLNVCSLLCPHCGAVNQSQVNVGVKCR